MGSGDRPLGPRPAAPSVRHLGRTGRLVGGMLLVGILVAAVSGIRSLSAAGTPSISVNPPQLAQIYYKPTPITITINASDLSGPGLTPVSAWQYGLQWDPTVLKWLSGPDVGPGTPTPVRVLPCGQTISTAVTPTPTPTGFLPTSTSTPTSTPAPGTPSNTPTATFTPSLTPTPAGYIQVACATIPFTTPIPGGVIGTFTFLPVATAPAFSPLNLINVYLLDHGATPVVPTVLPVPGLVRLVPCRDLDGDGKITVLDLSALTARFGMKVGDPGWNPLYDVVPDGQINILDISTEAGAFGLTC